MIRNPGTVLKPLMFNNAPCIIIIPPLKEVVLFNLIVEKQLNILLTRPSLEECSEIIFFGNKMLISRAWVSNQRLSIIKVNNNNSKRYKRNNVKYLNALDIKWR